MTNEKADRITETAKAIASAADCCLLKFRSGCEAVEPVKNARKKLGQ
jgi:hypothetical protein